MLWVVVQMFLEARGIAALAASSGGADEGWSARGIIESWLANETQARTAGYPHTCHIGAAPPRSPVRALRVTAGRHRLTHWSE